MKKHGNTKRVITFLLMVAFVLSVAMPMKAFAQEKEKKVVRVGWHEAPYFITDENGRLSGYSYEYQRKVAAYTGWEYEYVEGMWSDLLVMLKNGEIDLLSDVSYTEDRANYMLYASLPMGTEAYYVFVAPDNKEITAENISALNGKKVGITKGTIQMGLFKNWAKSHDISVEIVEMNVVDDEALSLLGKKYDAFVTMDVYGSPDTAIPIAKIGSSDFYFAVSKNRPDLLNELDSALNRIQDEDKYYDQQLHDKYLRVAETDKYLSVAEKEWIAKHGTIKVGYQDNYLAFCAKDKETGELTGALKDYLDYASTAFENGKVDFETIAFRNTEEALDALKKGEIDCVFPANFTAFDAERMELLMTPPLMRSEMDAVVRASEQKEFLRKDSIVVAVNEGNTNYDLFLAENYPTWQRAYFKDTPTGLDAVAKGDADCVIISNYRYSNISKQCEKLRLTTVYTGVDMDYYFAVNEGEATLYSILSRVTGVVPEAVVHTALTYYSTEDVKTDLGELIKENLFIVMTVVSAILLIILILLLRSIRARKKIAEEEQLLRDLNRRVYVDALTSVRNKGAFTDYLEKLQERVAQGEVTRLGIGIFDCNDLKKVNDQCGHDKGDIYLKNACQLICKTFDHSPVFRIGGDEFAVFLTGSDYENREELIRTFEEKSAQHCLTAHEKWEETSIAHGIAIYDPKIDATIRETAKRADQLMYENKRKMKAYANGDGSF
ncbi:MAG: transporter substrate-binding domain-containing protein [Lachnospiraceae bacterium]|nr:transporter substrate-binding domain-containing protein [Lachnospiraceae bacterium]